MSQLEAIYNELLAIKEKAESKRVKNLEKKKKTKNSKRSAITAHNEARKCWRC